MADTAKPPIMSPGDASLPGETSTQQETVITEKHAPDSDGSQDLKPEKETDNVENEYVTGYKLAIVVASVALSCFLMLLDTMVISTAIPRITDEFNSLPDVGWYASAYQFGSAAPQPLTGKIFTHFKTKWSYLIFFGIFELGSVLCGAAVSSTMLIVGRAVAGLGAAGLITGAITIISSCAPLERRPALLGMLMGFNQLGLVAGPLIGGAFTSYSTWRWSFYINLPAGAIAAIAIALLRIPEQTPKARLLTVLKRVHHYLDLTGFVLFAPAVLQLLLAIQYGGNQYAWNSSQVIGLLCGSVATFMVWFFWNRHKGDDAMLPNSLISRMEVWSSGLFQAFLMSAVYGAIYFLPIYFQAINNTSPILSGVYLLPMILPQLFMAAASGAIITKIGYVIPLALFSTVLLSIASGLYSLLQPGSEMGKWIGFQVIGGLGSGAGLQVAIIAIQAVVTGEELSSGMAFMVFTQSLGPAIILAICNVIFVSNLRSEIAQHAPSVNAQMVIDAGATNFRKFVHGDDLPGVLVAYANSIDRVFYLVAAMAAACGIFSWGMGWHDVRKKDDGGQGGKDAADEEKEGGGK